jgi:DNA-binding NarL/FixJ family response regulator
MLTVEAEGQRVFESLKAGATGYLVKHVAPEEILEAVREVQSGGAPMSSQIARHGGVSFSRAGRDPGQEMQLSRGKSEILRLLACGDRSKEIADKLDIGVGTVNTHIRHIYEKLHVRSRADAHVARFVRE